MANLTYRNVAMDKIAIENGFNVRTSIDQEKIKELAGSMKAQGLLNPINIQKMADGTYKVVAGHRRFLAAQYLKWKEIPAAEVQAKDAEIVMMLENGSREQLMPHEEVIGFKRLADRGMSAREIARKVGVSNVLVSERLAVAAYPELVEAMQNDGLGFKRAVKLAKEAKAAKLETISQDMIDGKLDEQDKAAENKAAKRAETIAAKSEEKTETTPEPEAEATDELVTEEQEVLASISPELAEMSEGDFEEVDSFLAPTTSSEETSVEQGDGEAVNELTATSSEEKTEAKGIAEEKTETKTRTREKKALGAEPRMAELTTLLDFIDNAEELMSQWNEEGDAERGAFLAGTLYGLYMAVGYDTDAIKLLSKNPQWEEGF